MKRQQEEKRLHVRRQEAISALEAAAVSGREQAIMRLKAIDGLLFVLDGDFSDSDVRRIAEKRRYPIEIERALTLYGMMRRLMRLCEPCGSVVGPGAAVKLLDFEKLTLDELLDLKRGPEFNAIIAGRPNRTGFAGLELLTPEEQELYYSVKPYFQSLNKLTLKCLAVALLEYSDRSSIRYIQKLKEYQFKSKDLHRDYLIHIVNEFGSYRKTMRASAAEFQAMLDTYPVIRELVHATTLR